MFALLDDPYTAPYNDTNDYYKIVLLLCKLFMCCRSKFTNDDNKEAGHWQSNNVNQRYIKPLLYFS